MRAVTYAADEARQELLDSIAEAADELGGALAALGDAYEQLDEASADRLEAALFRPAQAAYGRAKQTHAGFAARHGLPQHAFAPPGGPGAPSRGVKDFVAEALDRIEQADAILSELQDSLSPVQVGDPELRAGIADVRSLIADLSRSGQQFVSGFGR